MSWIEDNAELMYPGSDLTYGAGAVRESYAYGARAARERVAIIDAAQPVMNSAEELDAQPQGTIIMATGGNWNPEHPELFLKCGYAHAPWMALDPSDRDDGENLEPSGAVLRWRCDGEARVIYRPEVSA